jgi:inorganic pyrophosphatase
MVQDGINDRSLAVTQPAAVPPLLALRDLAAQHFGWEAWEEVIERNGITIERPRRSQHPQFPEIIYPIDYGYVNGTIGPDGVEVDVFVGTAANGLVGVILTDDHRRGDREVKLLYHCLPEEVYLVNGFINFNPQLMQGVLVMRRPLHLLW